MTGPGLRRRDPDLQELMDDPDCDLTQLRRTYAQFQVVNRLLAGWGGLYRRRIRPLLAPDRVTTLLDVGSGGGDVPRALARWAARDGLTLAVTAVDPDERAHAYATDLPRVPGLTFRRTTSSALVEEGAEFDVVVSNHVLHHLDAAGLDRLLADSERLSRRLVVHNDIARSRWAYAAYAVGCRPFGRRSFLLADGLRSIRRSYTLAELADCVPPGWTVARQAPARLLLLREADPAQAAGGHGTRRSESMPS